MSPPKTISIMPEKVSNEIISIYDEFLAAGRCRPQRSWCPLATAPPT